VRSAGSVKLPWSFAGELKMYEIPCSVLPSCSHDLILGGTFLRLTQTLTKFFHRIKTTLRSFSQRSGVRLLGSEKERVWGYLSGTQTCALPDFGSDVMAISAQYAMQRGLLVNDSADERLELELADGSLAYTNGVVKGLEWSFGTTEHPFVADFHVLEGLPVDVILSADFLYGCSAFSTYDEFFYQEGSHRGFGGYELGNIKHVGWFSDRLHNLYERYLSTSRHTYSPPSSTC
jgi:hypothetical protein